MNNGMKLEYLRNSCLAKVKNKNQYQLKRVDIISPYISEQFFKSLKTLAPKKIRITTDAACSPVIIDNIMSNFPDKIEKINLAQCEGIVHAKCYLFHWRNESTKKFRRLFLWGSCNATDGGFRRNAEVYSWINLSQMERDKRKLLLNYFDNIRESNVTGIQLDLANGLFVKLPNITHYTPEISSFDLWVQRGRLCHSFPNDPSFRHLRLTLKSKMSPKDELSDALVKNNIDINQQAGISYDYLRYNNSDIEYADIDDDFTSTWRSKYFIDTVYGLWTSEGCFNENKDVFHKSDKTNRQKEIDIISKANTGKRNEWCNNFIKIIQQISGSISNPSEYFYFKDGELDIDKYEQQFLKQLNRDFLRSQDTWFKHGYISGYDFPEVPPMREFTSHWNELIQSFSESLFFEINKSGTRNWLAQTVRDYTDIGFPIDSDTLLEELNRNWNAHKEYIECFYCKE